MKASPRASLATLGGMDRELTGFACPDAIAVGRLDADRRDELAVAEPCGSQVAVLLNTR